MNYQAIKRYSAADYEPPDPGEDLAEKTKRYCADHCVEWEEAWQKVIGDPRNADLVAAYSSPNYKPAKTKAYSRVETFSGPSVGEEMHRRTLDAMQQFNEQSYETAFELALELAPKSVRERYARGQS